MTDADTLTPCPHLEPCPWCGCALYTVWRRANPRASCKTEGCFGRKTAVVNLDDPSDVAAWNRRAPTPAPTDAATAGMQPVARIEEVDEYGPRLEWTQHWVDAGVGAKLFSESQVQAMLTAAPRNAPLYDPDDVAFSARCCADGVDALSPELASTARPTSIAAAKKGGQHVTE